MLTKEAYDLLMGQPTHNPYNIGPSFMEDTSKNPERAQQLQAANKGLKKHFSKGSTYRDWLHDSNTWARRTMQKVPGAIPYALGGAYDLLANGVDAIPNYANLAWKSMLGKGNQWRDKKYLRTDNNWGYKVGDWLTDNVGKPVEQFINPVGNAISGLTSDNRNHYGDNLSTWQQLFGRPWSEKPQYSQSLQKADPLNVMGMIEDAGADAITGGMLTKGGNVVSNVKDINKSNKWYAKQQQVIDNHVKNKLDKVVAPIKAQGYDLLKNESPVALRNSILDTEYKRYGGDRGWLKRQGAKVRRNQLSKKLNTRDKIYQFILDNPEYMDYGWNNGTLNKIHPEEIKNIRDVIAIQKQDAKLLKDFTRDYQKAPSPPVVRKLKNILKDFGPEPLFKGSYGNPMDVITDARIKGDQRVWFSPLPEVSMGYGTHLGIFDIPEDMRDTVKKLRTPHVAGRIDADDLLTGKIRGEDLAQKAGRSNIGSSPDYEVAMPPDLLPQLVTARNDKGGAAYRVFQQIKPTNLDEVLAYPRRITEPIPDKILNVPLYEPIVSPYYRSLQDMYGKKLPLRYTYDVLSRPKVFNFKPYQLMPYTDKIGNKYIRPLVPWVLPSAIPESQRTKQ